MNDQMLLCTLSQSQNSNDKNEFAYRPARTVPFPKSHAEALFSGAVFMEKGADLFDDLAVIQDDKADGWALHIKEKKGTYLRLVLVHQNKNIFMEKYCGWDDWTALKNELSVLRDDINSLIKNSRLDVARERTGLLKEVLSKLLTKTGLHEVLNAGNSARLDVFYGRDTTLLPFEAFSDKWFVRTFVPGKKKPCHAPKDGFTLIYAEELGHAQKEAAEISAAVKDRFSIELYSDRLYDRHRNGPTQSRFLHFAGHGTVSDGKGRIHFGNVPLDSMMYPHDVELAFLNCCHVGSVSDGIVSSLLNEGVMSIIASPFEVPDTYPETVGDFYRSLNSGEIGLSWRLFCLKNPYFGLFFRFFSAY